MDDAATIEHPAATADEAAHKRHHRIMTDNIRLQRRVNALEKALEFYADSRRYMGANQRNETSDPFSPGPYLQDVTRDGGDIARQALRDHAGGGA